MGNCASTPSSADTASALPAVPSHATPLQASTYTCDDATCGSEPSASLNTDFTDLRCEAGHDHTVEVRDVCATQSSRRSAAHRTAPWTPCGNPLAGTSVNGIAPLNSTPLGHIAHDNDTATPLSQLSRFATADAVDRESYAATSADPHSANAARCKNAESPRVRPDDPLVCREAGCGTKALSDQSVTQSFPSLDSIDPEYGEKFTRCLQKIPSLGQSDRIALWLRGLAVIPESIPEDDPLLP